MTAQVSRDTRYPIIYVRGYAMTKGERNDTAADPFCGFNLGSTVYRATGRRSKPSQHFFESPVVRLMSEFKYGHVYDSGRNLMDPPDPDEPPRKPPGIPPASIIIYRYYDQGSELVGNGEHGEIKEFAKGLSALILRVKTLVGENLEAAAVERSEPFDYEQFDKEFRVYLVAHSMGGLVTRAFLQNPELGDDVARSAVEKVFTYATPHNGIDVLGRNVPNLPDLLNFFKADTFSVKEMRKYLNLFGIGDEKCADLLPATIHPPADKWFCLIGTNRSDYEVAFGASRTFVGNGSDGLVRIENASLKALQADGSMKPVARAYAYRAHSGYFGIVNAEETYQNLVRFLFGDVRVDIWFEIDEIALPKALRTKANVEATYQFELLASTQGKRWYLSRRLAEEDSPACREHSELISHDENADQARKVYLSTVFLSNRAKVDSGEPGLNYSIVFAIRVPDYLVGGRFWERNHFEGASLFYDNLIVRMIPPRPSEKEWKVTGKWGVSGQDAFDGQPTYESLGGGAEFVAPLPHLKRADDAPSISGQLRLVARKWS